MMKVFTGLRLEHCKSRLERLYVADFLTRVAYLTKSGKQTYLYGLNNKFKYLPEITRMISEQVLNESKVASVIDSPIVIANGKWTRRYNLDLLIVSDSVSLEDRRRINNILPFKNRYWILSEEEFFLRYVTLNPMLYNWIRDGIILKAEGMWEILTERDSYESYNENQSQDRKLEEIKDRILPFSPEFEIGKIILNMKEE